MIEDKNTRILLVEDHPLYRMGLRTALAYADPTLEIINEAEDVKSAKDFIWRNTSIIDLILLDYYLPDGTGFDVIRHAKQYCPDAKILIISADIHNTDIKMLLEAGINGFIDKDITSMELALIINSVLHNHNYFDSDILQQIDEQNSTHSLDGLTQREIDVIRLCVKGLSAKQVAEKLNISPRTVEKHKDKIFNKIGVNNMVELTNYAIRNKII